MLRVSWHDKVERRCVQNKVHHHITWAVMITPTLPVTATVNAAFPQKRRAW